MNSEFYAAIFGDIPETESGAGNGSSDAACHVSGDDLSEVSPAVGYAESTDCATDSTVQAVDYAAALFGADPVFELLACPDNAAVAAHWAAQGFAVMPVRDWGDGDGWKPVRDWQSAASTDPATVAAWWRKWPDARVGLPTGARNGIACLDLDRKNGVDGLASLASLGFAAELSPVRVQTPSGGLHLLFRHDPRLRNYVGRHGAGIDVRAEGGFIIAPGTYKGAGRYLPDGAALGSGDLPAFPETLVPAVDETAPVATIEREPTAAEIQSARDRLAQLTAALATAPDGTRNATLNDVVAEIAGAAGAHGMLSAAECRAALESAWLALGKPAREFRATFRSAWTAGLRKPLSYLLGIDPESAFEDQPEDSTPAPSRPAARLEFLSPAQCADMPPRGYVIKGLIAPGDVGCIFGAPGAGKSLLAPALGYAVAQGRAAFGMRTRAGRVLYVAAEDIRGMHGRTQSLRRRYGEADEFLVGAIDDLLSDGSPDLKALLALVKETRPTMIIIDTLAAAFPGLEENSPDGMSTVVGVGRRLAAHGAAVVFIHHDRKDGAPMPRGHSLFNGALDFALQLKPKDTDGIVRGTLTKNRNGTIDREFAFRIGIEVMGEDSDGDPITFAVCEELAAGTAPRRPKLSGAERAALGVLLAMIDRTGAAAVDENEWRERCIDGREVSAANDRDSRKRAFNRAFQGLMRTGALSTGNGMVCPVDHPGTHGCAFDSIDPEAAFDDVEFEE
jgi:hypothetical protein